MQCESKKTCSLWLFKKTFPNGCVFKTNLRGEFVSTWWNHDVRVPTSGLYQISFRSVVRCACVWPMWCQVRQGGPAMLERQTQQAPFIHCHLSLNRGLPSRPRLTDWLLRTQQWWRHAGTRIVRRRQISSIVDHPIICLSLWINAICNFCMTVLCTIVIGIFVSCGKLLAGYSSVFGLFANIVSHITS